MKRITQKISFRSYTLFALAFGSVLWLSSCSSDDEPKDSTLPQATISGLTDDMAVWNDVPIVITASDDNSLKTVDVFVDGDLVKTFTDAPYETDWDSNTVSDGEHTIKVVVTDAAGNRTEKQVTVVVKNILVTLTISPNQFNSEYSERGFLFLSNEEGKVIKAIECTNGQSYELKSSDFDGNKFYLTEVSRFVRSDETYTRFVTCAAVERGGKWFLSPNPDLQTTVFAGQATLNWTNADESMDLYFISANGGSYTINGEYPFSLGMTKSPGKLYVVGYDLDNDNRTYGLYSDIVVGPNTIDLSLVDKTLGIETFNAPEGTIDLYAEVRGFPTVNNYAEYHYLGFSEIIDGESSSYDVYYPGTAFPYYETLSRVWMDDVYYSRRASGINTVVPTAHTASIEFTSDAINYSFTGNADLANMYFFVSQFESWDFILEPGANKSIPKFELPTLLAGFDLQQFVTPETYSSLGVYDFDELEGYNDYLSFSQRADGSAEFLKQRNYTYCSISLDPENSGGRKKRDFIKETLNRLK